MSWFSSNFNRTTGNHLNAPQSNWNGFSTWNNPSMVGGLWNFGVNGANVAGSAVQSLGNLGSRQITNSLNTINSGLNPAGNYIGDRLYVRPGDPSGTKQPMAGQLQLGDGSGSATPPKPLTLQTPPARPSGAGQLQSDPSKTNSSNPASSGGSTGLSGNGMWNDLWNRIATRQYNGGFDSNGNPKNSNYSVNRPDYVTSIQNGYVDMYNQGSSPEMSRWGQAAYDRSRADQGYALEDARQQSLTDAGQGMNTLAMQGGLESGAAENLMRSAQRNASNARTNLYRQGSMDRMGIDVADASRKDDMVRQGLSGGMDVARYDTDVQNLNVQNALKDAEMRQNWDMNQLMLQGNMLGSLETSNAIKNQRTSNPYNQWSLQNIGRNTWNSIKDFR